MSGPSFLDSIQEACQGVVKAIDPGWGRLKEETIAHLLAIFRYLSHSEHHIKALGSIAQHELILILSDAECKALKSATRAIESDIDERAYDDIELDLVRPLDELEILGGGDHASLFCLVWQHLNQTKQRAALHNILLVIFADIFLKEVEKLKKEWLKPTYLSGQGQELGQAETQIEPVVFQRLASAIPEVQWAAVQYYIECGMLLASLPRGACFLGVHIHPLMVMGSKPVLLRVLKDSLELFGGWEKAAGREKRVSDECKDWSGGATLPKTEASMLENPRRMSSVKDSRIAVAINIILYHQRTDYISEVLESSALDRISKSSLEADEKASRGNSLKSIFKFVRATRRLESRSSSVKPPM